MTRKRIAITGGALVVAIVAIFILWKEVIAPTKDQSSGQTTQTTPTPQPTPNPDPTPTPTPTSTATEGTLTGKADTATLHITKIVVYKNGEATEISLDANGNFSMDLAPGDYTIDYIASPDLYPHSPEKFSIIAGQTHEVDFMVEK